METETGRVRSADGTTIVFDRAGEGPPLVLVLGAFCDRTTPRSLAAVLAPDFTVYAYDRRGKGGSGDTAPYAVQREVEDLAAVIAAAGGSAAVFGHSSGAALALEGAAAGLPITGLAAYEPPYFVEGSRPIPVGMEQRVRDLVASGRRAEAIRLFMVEGVLESPEAVAMTESSPMWPALEAVVHTLPYDLACCSGHRLPVGRLAAIAVPTLVLGGGDSPEWFRATVQAVAAAIPGARHALLDGQTHAAADDVLAPVLVDALGPLLVTP